MPPVDIGVDGAEAGAEVFETLGALLAAKRRARGLSFGEVETATRVRAEYLEAIEDMDPRRLPDGPYAAGFVRTYAQYLGLDGQDAADRFRREMAPPGESRIVRAKQAPPERPRANADLLIGIAAAVVATAFLAVAIWPRPSDGPREARSLAPSETLLAWAREDPGAPRALDASEIPALVLQGRVDTSIEVREANGRVVRTGPLARGESFEAPPLRGLVAATPNGGAVEVFRGGVSLGRMGEPGVPVSGWSIDAARGESPPPQE